MAVEMGMGNFQPTLGVRCIMRVFPFEFTVNSDRPGRNVVVCTVINQVLTKRKARQQKLHGGRLFAERADDSLDCLERQAAS